MRLVTLAVIILASQAAHGQAFEVASVKPTGTSGAGRKSIDPQQVTYSNFTLRNLLQEAYGMEKYQIGGPDWLQTQRYDIVAKLPPNASRDQIPEMLKGLLLQQLRMIVHTEVREDRVYALVVAKSGPRLKRSEDQSGRPLLLNAIANGHLEFRFANLNGFASALSSLMGSPVVDKTGIGGYFDISLDVTMTDLAGMAAVLATNGATPDLAPNDSSTSVFTAIQELGLKLDTQRAPIQHLVVDTADRMPIGH